MTLTVRAMRLPAAPGTSAHMGGRRGRFSLPVTSSLEATQSSEGWLLGGPVDLAGPRVQTPIAGRRAGLVTGELLTPR
jgi:hypothetical protein